MWFKTEGGSSIQTTQIAFLKGYEISTHKGNIYEVWARLTDGKVVPLKSFEDEEKAKKFFYRISKKIGG